MPKMSATHELQQQPRLVVGREVDVDIMDQSKRTALEPQRAQEVT
jgi:hypothetical protein